jgi:hypothetical protein
VDEKPEDPSKKLINVLEPIAAPAANSITQTVVFTYQLSIILFSLLFVI